MCSSATWERQQRLDAPLYLGEKTGIFKMVWDTVERMNAHPDRDDPNVLGGCPSSPGRVTAVARVIRGLDDIERLAPGEILVAPITTPAWTVAFARAAGVVTDTGSYGSHASIVAREHGIPAVVATGSGTTRIRDGQRIRMDGATGIVHLAP
jgi:pyruvate,water dikinase